MGLAGSTTGLTIQGLRSLLEAFAQRAVLDAHYERHPHARPRLDELALAAAELDANPLAHQPELLQRAADEVLAVKPEATPDEVLLYAAGLAAGLAA